MQVNAEAASFFIQYIHVNIVFYNITICSEHNCLICKGVSTVYNCQIGVNNTMF